MGKRNRLRVVRIRAGLEQPRCEPAEVRRLGRIETAAEKKASKEALDNDIHRIRREAYERSLILSIKDKEVTSAKV